ncbi:hornerin-like [Iris pallida]|uniref:Hornerin-like n=1 Tax=Iris pallida TaxID=29817 RepID=A0AAX6GL05_IRIPA|nr:hornerin-like [Iris pallida]
MNRKPGYGAQLRANLEPTKGVGRLRQQDGGHGSRNPLRRVCNNSPAESTSPENGWRSSARPTPGHRGDRHAPMSRRARRPPQNPGHEPGRSGRRCGSWW